MYIMKKIALVLFSLSIAACGDSPEPKTTIPDFTGMTCSDKPPAEIGDTLTNGQKIFWDCERQWKYENEWVCILYKKTPEGRNDSTKIDFIFFTTDGPFDAWDTDTILGDNAIIIDWGN